MRSAEDTPCIQDGGRGHDARSEVKTTSAAIAGRHVQITGSPSLLQMATFRF